MEDNRLQDAASNAAALFLQMLKSEPQSGTPLRAFPAEEGVPIAPVASLERRV